MTIASIPPALGYGLGFRCRAVSGDGISPFWVAAGDFNADGSPDLVVTYIDSEAFSVFLNDGQGSFHFHGSQFVGRVPRGIAVADLNGDTKLDLTIANATSHDVVILLGRGDGTFAQAQDLRPGFAPFHPLRADLDGDGLLDLIVVNESNWVQADRPGTIAVLRGKADGTTSRWYTLEAGRHPSFGVLVDVDGDQRRDLVVTNWKTISVSTFLARADGTFAPAIHSKYQGAPTYSAAPFDFDGDGLVDLATTDLESGLHVLRGDGHGNFRLVRDLPSAGAGTRHVTAADLDRDGRLDLVASDMASSAVSLYQRKANGEFAKPVAIPVGKDPRMVLVTDLNGDGKLDMVTANEGERTISVLLQADGAGVSCVDGEAQPEVFQTRAGGGKRWWLKRSR